MKNLGNFLIGSLSSFGVAQALPESVNTAANAPVEMVNSIEALISLLSGLLSAIVVAWFKRKWDQKTKLG